MFKKARRLTLSLAILTFINHGIWLLLTDIILLTNKREDWYYWEISTMSYDELSVWRSSEIFGIICLLSVHFYLSICITMFVCYVKLRKNEKIPKFAYLVVSAFQIALIAFAISAKMFTPFGAFWFVLNTIILALSILQIRNSEREPPIGGADL
jgi:hypothetical protein